MVNLLPFLLDALSCAQQPLPRIFSSFLFLWACASCCLDVLVVHARGVPLGTVFSAEVTLWSSQDSTGLLVLLLPCPKESSCGWDGAGGVTAGRVTEGLDKALADGACQLSPETALWEGPGE